MNTASLRVVSEDHNAQAFEESGEAKNPRNLVPEGIYQAQAVGYKRAPFKNGIKIYFQFRITDLGELLEKEVWGCFQEYSKYGPRSKFYKFWEIAHRRRPQKKEQLRPESLCGRIYRVKVKTVIKDEDGDQYPTHQQYSVVTKVLELITGNPKPNTNYRLPTSPSVSSKQTRRNKE